MAVLWLCCVVCCDSVVVMVVLGVMHGFWNFFVINFDRLHFSKHTDQCVRINPPKDF